MDSCDIDLGIGSIRQRTPATLSRKLLFGSPIVLVVPRGHPFAHKDEVTWEELKGQTSVFHSNKSLLQLEADYCGYFAGPGEASAQGPRKVIVFAEMRVLERQNGIDFTK